MLKTLFLLECDCCRDSYQKLVALTGEYAQWKRATIDLVEQASSDGWGHFNREWRPYALICPDCQHQ